MYHWENLYETKKKCFTNLGWDVPCFVWKHIDPRVKSTPRIALLKCRTFYIFVELRRRVFQHSISIPIGTRASLRIKCALFLWLHFFNSQPPFHQQRYSNITSAQYGIYISELIRYSRVCAQYSYFLDRALLLTQLKLLKQGYVAPR